MHNLLYLATISSVLIIIITWGIRVLPKENWQFLACAPLTKTKEGKWIGVNFTYYGFFNATATISGIILALILISALGIPLVFTISIILLILALCIPASSLIAYAVEKKNYTFSVGGASFIGIIVSPWVVWLVNALGTHFLSHNFEVLPVLAAFSIAYAIGEGIGRLACLSFGCCYGAPLAKSHPFLQKLFRNKHAVFMGKTKKAAYAHNLDGHPLIPVQALTSLLYVIVGLSGHYLFLSGHFGTAFLLTIGVTQLWRFLSELLRADYRGEGTVSAYQKMALLSFLYAITIYFFFPAKFSIPLPNITTGIKTLWNPAVIMLLQLLWLMIFFYTGRSRVTGATISLHVIKENV